MGMTIPDKVKKLQSLRVLSCRRRRHLRDFEIRKLL